MVAFVAETGFESFSCQTSITSMGTAGAAIGCCSIAANVRLMVTSSDMLVVWSLRYLPIYF